MTEPSQSRFAVFAGEDYYPTGGWRDLIDTEATVDDAEQLARRISDEDHLDWFHIVDLDTREIVRTGWRNTSSRTDTSWHIEEGAGS